MSAAEAPQPLPAADPGRQPIDRSQAAWGWSDGWEAAGWLARTCTWWLALLRLAAPRLALRSRGNGFSVVGRRWATALRPAMAPTGMERLVPWGPRGRRRLIGGNWGSALGALLLLLSLLPPVPGLAPPELAPTPVHRPGLSSPAARQAVQIASMAKKQLAIRRSRGQRLAPLPPALAGPVDWREVPASAEGRQWWDAGSLRRDRRGQLSVLSRFQPAAPADREQAQPPGTLYVMELDCAQALYRDISVNGLPRWRAEWVPAADDSLSMATLRSACEAAGEPPPQESGPLASRAAASPASAAASPAPPA